MAYWYYRWDWGEAAGFDGIEAASDALDWEPGRKFLREALCDELAEWGVGLRPSRFAPLRCLLHAREELGEAAVKDVVLRVCGDLMSSRRSSSGAFLLDEGRSLVFVDSLYGDPALLAEAGSLYEDERLVKVSVELAIGALRELQDDASGLVRHFADTATGVSPGVYWGRGNGWAVLGLSDLLASLPEGGDERAELRERLRALVEGLVLHQSSSGGWRNVIPEGTSYPEASTTAMVVAGITQGVGNGDLDPSYLGAASAGWEAIAHRIDSSGHLVGVSYRPGLNSYSSRYEHAPVVGVYPWGNGPFLRAAAQRVPQKKGVMDE